MAHVNIKSFKCDATFIKSEVTRKYNRGIVLINFNIPEEIWLTDDKTSAQNLAFAARAIFDFLIEKVGIEIYPKDNERAYFSVSSTYTLEHVTTGESRLWTGTFNPQFSGDIENFVAFTTRAAFVKYMVDKCNTETMTKKAGELVANISDSDTDWTLGEIKSLIVSVQALSKSTNAFIVLNQLQGSQKTFLLDFD